MATMIIAGEKLQMPVWLKARLLEVITTADPSVLSVESGSERGKFYPVRHDGRVALSCPCRATIEKCAHMLAAERYLVSVEVLGAEMASDLPAHIDDELASQDNDGELGVQAEVIIREERERKAEKAAKVDPYHYYRVCALNGVERRYERTPSGSMVPMR